MSRIMTPEAYAAHQALHGKQMAAQEATENKITQSKPVKQDEQFPVVILVLPYPHPALSPNRKNGAHWTKTNAIKKSAFDAAYAIAKQATYVLKFQDVPHALKITFVQSDKRHRDWDNLASAGKPFYDGIAAALGINDRNFCPIMIDRGYDKKQACTIIEITQT